MDPAKASMAIGVILYRLNHIADDAPEPMWKSIHCSRMVAYGCGRHGQKLGLLILILILNFGPIIATMRTSSACALRRRRLSSPNRPWDTKTLHFPDLPDAFDAEAMFSFEGKVFWADLSRGFTYRDLRATAGTPAVEFDFIGLPYGYEILFADLPEDELTEPPEMNRTISAAPGVASSSSASTAPGGTPATRWCRRGL
ncbi:hypothetical protein C2845_PM02G44690 [Panicum miliaceum]|uniref:DUF1618 domain-containing protein n=1 Tax=Panicum miliaceum TaxID=4540 RepID=A0A3L6SGV7_PANMI|nr:hypothetical protein C2845_PM02G44690 [Panicum miliaceum]